MTGVLDVDGNNIVGVSEKSLQYLLDILVMEVHMQALHLM